jgi:hypothetical protein
LIYQLKSYNGNEDLCFEKRDLIKKEYLNSIDDSIDYFSKQLTLHKQLLSYLKNADYERMKKLCDNKSKI